MTLDHRAVSLPFLFDYWLYRLTKLDPFDHRDQPKSNERLLSSSSGSMKRASKIATKSGAFDRSTMFVHFRDHMTNNNHGK